MNVELLKIARDNLPPRLNRGILGSLGGVCALSYMWRIGTGGHGIHLFGAIQTMAHPDRRLGGPITEVIARTYDIPVEQAERLMRTNDDAPASERTNAVRRILNEWIEQGE